MGRFVAPRPPMNQSQHPAEIAVPVTEERLEVGREVVDTGRTLRLRKQVEERLTEVREPVATEVVDVQRVPVGRVVTEAPQVRHEGDVMVVPVVEERLVTRKELVLVEEIRLARRREVVEGRAEVVLRRERVLVERFDPGTGQWKRNLQGAAMLTVIGAFDDRTQAQGAVDRLVQRGFDRNDVHIEQQEGGGMTRPTGHDNDPRPESDGGGIGGFFSHLFGGSEKHHEHASTYHEAVQRGSSVVVVDARDEAQAGQAVECLHELGAINVDERAQQWRASGWAPPPVGQSRGTLRDDAPPQGQEGVLDVVQEELHVGKRSLDKGGVRVVQRVTEKPVREVVRLREEHATVDRRPVDREATTGDLNAFKEGTLEVRESAEEAVVGKTARVVEEVRVGKEVREREQTVEDKVRRKDVDVQRMDGSTRATAERERAVASDRVNEPPMAERDPDAGLAGTRRPTLRKNDPST
jgi:stress response protein YsnF